MVPVFVAMKQELDKDLDGSVYEKVLMGIGKINATMATTEYLCKHPDTKLVINVGTAGSHRFPYASLVNCVSFVQRDWDTRALGDPKYANKNDPLTPTTTFSYGSTIGSGVIGFPYETGVVGTGDSFCDAMPEGCDLVDMESFAIAKVCKKFNVNFLCVKFVSDGANKDSARQFYEVLHDATDKLYKFLEDIKPFVDTAFLEQFKRMGQA